MTNRSSDRYRAPRLSKTAKYAFLTGSGLGGVLMIWMLGLPPEERQFENPIVSARSESVAVLSSAHSNPVASDSTVATVVSSTAPASPQAEQRPSLRHLRRMFYQTNAQGKADYILRSLQEGEGCCSGEATRLGWIDEAEQIRSVPFSQFLDILREFIRRLESSLRMREDVIDSLAALRDLGGFMRSLDLVMVNRYDTGLSEADQAEFHRLEAELDRLRDAFALLEAQNALPGELDWLRSVTDVTSRNSLDTLHRLEGLEHFLRQEGIASHAQYGVCVEQFIRLIFELQEWAAKREYPEPRPDTFLWSDVNSRLRYWVSSLSRKVAVRSIGNGVLNYLQGQEAALDVQSLVANSSHLYWLIQDLRDEDQSSYAVARSTVLRLLERAIGPDLSEHDREELQELQSRLSR